MLSTYVNKKEKRETFVQLFFCENTTVFPSVGGNKHSCFPKEDIC